MAVSKDHVRIWITIHKDTKKSIELLMPLLKAKSMGDVVDRAIVSYALAIMELVANKNSSKEERKENQDEKIN